MLGVNPCVKWFIYIVSYLYALSHLVTITSLLRWFYYYPFYRLETERAISLLAQGLINNEIESSDQNPGPRSACAAKLTRCGISRGVKRCLTVTSCATEHFRAFPNAEAPFLSLDGWLTGLPPGPESFCGASNSRAAVESVIPQLDPGKRLSGVPRCYLLGYLCVDNISLPHKSLPHAQR